MDKNKMTQEYDKWEQKKFDLFVKSGYCLDGDSILDIGCGNKNFFEHLKLKGIKPSSMVGYDTDEEYCNISLENIKGKFDIITMWEVIEHLTTEQFKEYLKWIKEHLRKYLVVSTPNYNNKYYPFYDEPTHIMPYNIKTLTEILNKNGFKITHTKKSHYLVNPYKIFNSIKNGWDIYCKIFMVVKIG